MVYRTRFSLLADGAQGDPLEHLSIDLWGVEIREPHEVLNTLALLPTL
jgi:hypothetical protein